MVQINFDASSVAPSQGIQAVPAGMYKVVLEEATKEPVGRSTPQNPMDRLALKFRILDGQYSGRFLFHNLNLWLNDKPKAVEISYGELSAICHAVDVLQMTDTQQLIGKPLEVRVSFRPARTVTDPQTQETKTYDESNDIKLFKKIEGGGMVGGPQMPAGFGAPQAPAGFGAPQQMPPGFGAQQQQFAPPQQQMAPQGQQAPFGNGYQGTPQQGQGYTPQQQQGQAPFAGNGAGQPAPQQMGAPMNNGAPAQQDPSQAQPPFLQQGAQQPWNGQPQQAAGQAPFGQQDPNMTVAASPQQAPQQGQQAPQQGGIPSWAQGQQG